MECSLSCAAIVIGVVVVGVILLRKFLAGGTFTGIERIPGKTVIVTGANIGIGKETARELARRGGRVILACRDTEKAQRAREDIVSDTHNDNVLVRKLDLASIKSIRAFADEINANEPEVHILINNAGVMYCPKTLTEDGFETQIGVNHMGHFLLTNLLLDKLKSSTPSRIVNVSSMGHNFTTINFDDLNSETSYSPYRAYHQSKLANVLFTRELARRLQGTGVTAYALHPGVVDTELPRHFTLKQNAITSTLMTPLNWLTFKTPSQGAQTSIYCALASELEGVSGRYYSDCQEKRPSKAAQDDESARRLWTISEQWTKLA